MSRNIAVSDDVYERLKREKGDRSFSDIIREKLSRGGKIADVAGAKVLDRETLEGVKDDIGRMTEVTEERMEA